MQPHTSSRLAKLTTLGFAVLSLAFTACNSSGTKEAATDTAASEPKTETDSMETSMLYVGTYADPDSASIFLFRLNPASGELTQVNAFKGGENPSFLTLDAERKHLFAVNETGNYEGQNSGAVSAFAVDQQTGNLTFLNRVASRGGAPCHISVAGDNKDVLVANYTGGNVASFRVQDNGQLSAAADVEQHKGAGPNKERQEAAHAHYIAPDPNNKFILAVDLGTDQVLGYRLDAATGALTPNAPAVAFAAKPGSGPRHLAFHPNGKFAYLIHELNSTMTALRYDADKGTFTEIETVTTLPAGFKGESYCAEVKASADGKFLYGSNRGDNSIVVYAIDQNTGKLTTVQHVKTGGDWPRDFNIDRSGSVLLVANERSNNLVTFKIDKATGKLTATGHQVQVHKPVCVQVVPAP